MKGKILNVERTCQNPINRGQTLLELGDPSALEVQIDVLSADAVQLKPGMSVRFNRWGGQQTLNGVIRLIEPSGFTKLSALGLEEQRVWVIAQITSPAQEWQNLGDGYRVEAQFTLWHQDDVLQIPASCLFREGRDGHNNQNWAVFILKNGRAQRQTVTIGRNNGLHAQVISGLNQNQILINHPSDQIENGVRVKARPQK
nr:HlyD family efflux transporter periplasmic adaptor subunit [Thiomicrorhabdus aquaedulcis]